ncbi:MAG: alanine--tRNA ligase [bacterium]
MSSVKKNKMFTSSEVRQKFLEFFESKGHQRVRSSSLVPGNDPTLLFTNAGMVQFKDVFLGAEKRSYTRAVTSQRCVRAGGKHNDLDQVGYTARHHTFFEMLGNFSFGDYFKREAIGYAWEFLTQQLGLPEHKLIVTVFEEDLEAEKIWIEEIGVDPEKVLRIGAKDNFWAMGDTGPCGPCSEIFYDHGPEIEGGQPGTPEEDGDRFIEIWNLVFMQFDRGADGKLSDLPKPCVDTGMGLERLSAVLQHVHSNYEIDLFQHLIKSAATITGCKDTEHPSLRVLADHIRACSFLIIDGVLPSNEGRGYVLRRIIRRAVRHGYKLGAEIPFFYKLVKALVEVMADAYPELNEQQVTIENSLKHEEQRFAETLANGMKILEEAITSLSGQIIPGDVVFKLYDTYGFPEDLTADIARERKLEIDRNGFEQAMKAQRERARGASKMSDAMHIDATAFVHLPATHFTGYTQSKESECKVLAIIEGGKSVTELEQDSAAWIILDKTPFYAESGGQAADQGELFSNTAQFKVEDTQKFGQVFFVHQGWLESGKLTVGEYISAQIDVERRAKTLLNHSATHLLHAALRKVLGEHVSQKGSLVNADYLRFDFSHPQPMSDEELSEVERLVNENIRKNFKGDIEELSYDEAVNSGAMALFGEKYGDIVRVVRFGDYSVELCGGTHVDRSGDIGLFKITAETGVAAGIRRIEALTGDAAIEWVENTEATLKKVSRKLNTKLELIPERMEQLIADSKMLEKELIKLKSQMASAQGDELIDQVVKVGEINVLAATLSDTDMKTLRETMDRLKDKLAPAVIVLATNEDGKVRIACGVDKSLTKQMKAGDLIKEVAEKVGGKGGGRPDMAQAGGNLPEKLPEAIGLVIPWVENKT